MIQTSEYFAEKLKQQLQSASKYTPSLELTIWVLSNALHRYSMATHEIEEKGSVTMTRTTSQGTSSNIHPAAKVAAEAENTILKQFKALGLTAQDLHDITDSDPLVELTAKVHQEMKKGKTVRPDK